MTLQRTPSTPSLQRRAPQPSTSGRNRCLTYACCFPKSLLFLPATLMQYALSDHCSPYHAYLKTVHLSMLAAVAHPPTLLHAIMGNGCYM